MPKDRRVILVPVVVEIMPDGSIGCCEGPDFNMISRVLLQEPRQLRLETEALKQKRGIP